MLDFTNIRLCGRDNEKTALRDAYTRSTNSTFQVVWIKGLSGTGKSALVESVFSEDESQKYVFCSGKFEQQRSVVPHSALATLLLKLWRIIEQDYPDIQLCSDDLKVLSNLVPEMGASAKLYPNSSSDKINSEWGLERLKQALRSFVKHVCCKVDSPLVVHFDDLQWADLDTLSILEDLLSDLEQSNFLFIASYRDNEVSTASPLIRCIRKTVSMRPQCVTDIHLLNLDQSHMCELVADLLHISQKQATPLGNLIHQETEGNCFFALVMIRHIYDQGLMYRSSKTNQWKWNIEKIRGEVAVSDNVVDLLGQKLASLPQETANALKMSAFLGTRINIALLERLIPVLESKDKSASTVHDVLDAAMQAHLIKIDPDRSHFTFSHDRVEATVYAMAAKEISSPLLHLRIGRCLRSDISTALQITQNEESEHNLFLATDQLNRGATLITNNKEKFDLARLNLTVAKKVMKRGAFQMSLTFLDIAVTLLGGNKWEEDYEMTLDLSNTLAFVLLSNGKADACLGVVEEVQLHAKCPEDSYEVHNIHLEMLVSTNRLNECLTVGLRLVREMGYPKVPRKPSLIRHVIPNVINVKRLLKGMSDEDLLNLNPWPDDKQAQRFIVNTFNILLSVAYFLNETELIPIFTCNIMQQTLLHGATLITGTAFSSYGVLLSILGDFDGAMRFATLANGMMTRFEEEPICLFAVHAMLIPLKYPMHGSVSTTLRAYQMAFSKGDLRYAGQAAHFHIMIRLTAGLPLQNLAEDGFAFCRQLQKYDQLVMFKFLLTTLRAVAELMDSPSDVSEFVGEALDDQEFEDHLRRGGATAMHFALFWMFAMEARYYLGNMDSALGFAEKVWKSKALEQMPFVFMIEYHLISALIAIRFWKSTRKRRFWRTFRMHQKVLASWAEKGNVNTLHLVALLDAVMYVNRHRKVDFETGRESFVKAISMATRCGFVHHAALANELVGKYCLESNTRDVYWACFYMTSARDQYTDWNATAKVHQMEFEYKFLFEPNIHMNGSASSFFVDGLNSSLQRQSSSQLTGRSRAIVIAETEKTYTREAWTA